MGTSNPLSLFGYAAIALVSPCDGTEGLIFGDTIPTKPPHKSSLEVPTDLDPKPSKSTMILQPVPRRHDGQLSRRRWSLNEASKGLGVGFSAQGSYVSIDINGEMPENHMGNRMKILCKYHVWVSPKGGG